MESTWEEVENLVEMSQEHLEVAEDGVGAGSRWPVASRASCCAASHAAIAALVIVSSCAMSAS